MDKEQKRFLGDLAKKFAREELKQARKGLRFCEVTTWEIDPENMSARFKASKSINMHIDRIREAREILGRS